MPEKTKDDTQNIMARLTIHKPKRIIALLTILFLLGCLVTALAYSQENRAADTALSNYTLEKIDEINDMVLKREAVPDSYLYYLKDNETLLESIKTYNQQTGILMASFTIEALSIVTTMCGLTEENGYILHGSATDYPRLPDEVHILIDKIARYALYENYKELIEADPSLEQIRVGELGGSYGMWPIWVHGNMTLAGNETQLEEYQAYQTLIKEILIQFEAYRQQNSM